MSNSESKRPAPPHGKKAALCIVDVQNDFVVGGAIAIEGGSLVVPVINDLRRQVAWDMIVVSRDWHPKGHVSFASTHYTKRVGEEIVTAGGVKQRLWPDHCVQGTSGAEFLRDLVVLPTDLLLEKGTDAEVDSYSLVKDAAGRPNATFFERAPADRADFIRRLREANITDVYFTGLALDYCVRASALDTVAAGGFKVYVIVDAAKGTSKEGEERARAELERAGVTLLTSASVVASTTAADPRVEAARYLKQHDIQGLFDALCTKLIFEQPEDPKRFLVDELKKLQAQKKGADYSSLNIFEEGDLEVLWTQLDAAKAGTISAQRMAQALTDLRVPHTIDTASATRYSLAQFKQLAAPALKR